MMPKRRRTRAENLANRIEAERKLNDDYVAERNKPPPSDSRICLTGNFAWCATLIYPGRMVTTLGLRERKKLGTRWALSDAALELAFERGLENVTREDIANRAGVSLRTFNNYFTGKYEAVAFRQVDRTRQSLAAFRQRPADEPLWSAITEAMLQPLEAEGAADMRPTPGELAVIRELLSARDLRAALTRDLFADWVDAIAERTGTDPARDMYPRLVTAVVRAVGETAMEAYAYADPPVAYTELLRRGFADVAAGLPER